MFFQKLLETIQKDDDPDEEDISYSLTIPIDIPISDKQGLRNKYSVFIKKEENYYI